MRCKYHFGASSCQTHQESTNFVTVEVFLCPKGVRGVKTFPINRDGNSKVLWHCWHLGIKRHTSIKWQHKVVNILLDTTRVEVSWLKPAIINNAPKKSKPFWDENAYYHKWRFLRSKTSDPKCHSNYNLAKLQNARIFSCRIVLTIIVVSDNRPNLR